MKCSIKLIYLITLPFFAVLFTLAIYFYSRTYESGADCIPITYPSTPPLVTSPIPTRVYGNLTCPIPLSLLPSSGPKVALASFPGSGNTWVRFLLQQSTGFHTGSVYIDHQLSSYGFLESVFNGSVIAIKTHESYATINKYFFKAVDYDKCILLVRNPKQTIAAEVNRYFTKHHTNRLHPSRWKSEYVQQKLLELILAWKYFIFSWSKFNQPLLVIQFEKLVFNYKHELGRILDFLELDFNPEGMQCLTADNSGYFTRSRKSDPSFSAEVLLVTQHVYSIVKPFLALHDISYQEFDV